MIFKIPTVLLPKDKDNLNKWATIACDQFTSQPDYWNKLNKYVGKSDSTLKITFPEIYLSKDNSQKIEQINSNMKDYLDNNIFEELKDTLIFVVRTLKNGKKRLGLMIEINLDHYDYTENNTALIKATEKTVVERLPVRIDIRQNAPLESPHIMLLMDDDKDRFLETLYEHKDQLIKLYDFELNMNGGHIEGYKVEKASKLISDILALNDKQMLFAVGDGNHSLATAKECWNKIKSTGKDIEGHPAQFALCELVSLYDASLEFEPIHRVIFNAGDDFIAKMKKQLKGKNKVKLYYNNKEHYINVGVASDAIKDIQNFIDEYMLENKAVEIDYVHGDDYVLEVAKRENAIAIYMPPIKKDELFDYIKRRGVLPRKAFSMGDAEDKRYYLEARKIIK